MSRAPFKATSYLVVADRDGNREHLMDTTWATLHELWPGIGWARIIRGIRPLYQINLKPKAHA